ncbi:MAG: hypothetical protein ABSB71_12220 [Candidatus Bathyarchaeia archaeon]
MKGFGHYARIANMLEGGNSTGCLRDFAKLSEIKFDKDGIQDDLSNLIGRADTKRQPSIGKKIINHEKWLSYSYLSLLIILGIIAYVPLFVKY